MTMYIQLRLSLPEQSLSYAPQKREKLQRYTNPLLKISSLSCVFGAGYKISLIFLIAARFYKIKSISYCRCTILQIKNIFNPF